MTRPGWWIVRTASVPMAMLLLLIGGTLRPKAAAHPDFSVLETAVQEEMREWNITGIAVAVVDDQKVVYSARFGEAQPDGVFRCGSISKLFAAVSVMQKVEEGKLNLDAPLEEYLPEYVPVNPFPTSGPITLRQLLCHRSGVVRESPVGGYFDEHEPGLDRMVASVAQTVLPTAPAARMRYSNVGPSLAGFAVAKVAGTPFEKYQQQKILGPLGMNDSAWLRKELRERIVPSYMRVANGQGGFRRQRTPIFDLGTVPAGNLFTTAEDLARFVSMLAAEGRTLEGKRILKAETLAEMFTPQLIQETNGFGLGFSIGSFQGRKTVGHNGAVYGFSSSLVFLPKERIGIVVLGNSDIVNARIQKLANLGLSLLLETKHGQMRPTPPETIGLTQAEMQRFAGEYESESCWAKLWIAEGKLVADVSSQPTKLRPIEKLKFLADSALFDSAPVAFEEAENGNIRGFRLGGQNYTRVPERTARIPSDWRKLLGSYGPKFIPLVISERHGHLYAMTENMVDYRLTPRNEHVFELPPGMYVNEYLVFFNRPGGRPHALSLAGMVLQRR